MQEKRKHKRIPLHYYLKVTETASDKHLGYMIDISKEGFKLLSEDQIPTGSEIIFTVQLPEDIKGWTELTFKAKACWSRKDVNPDYFVSGYHIDKMEPDGQTIISWVIHHYGHTV
jgi:hypothetical protein